MVGELIDARRTELLLCCQNVPRWMAGWTITARLSCSKAKTAVGSRALSGLAPGSRPPHAYNA